MEIICLLQKRDGVGVERVRELSRRNGDMLGE